MTRKGIVIDDEGKYDEANKGLRQGQSRLIYKTKNWYAKGLALKAPGRTNESDAAFARIKELRDTS